MAELTPEAQEVIKAMEQFFGNVQGTPTSTVGPEGPERPAVQLTEPSVDPVALETAREGLDQAGASTEGMEENVLLAEWAKTQATIARQEKLRWVIQFLPEITFDDLNFGALYDRIRQRGGDVGELGNYRNKGPEESNEEFEQRVVEEFFAQGPHIQQRVVLESWAAVEGLVQRAEKIETPHGDVHASEIQDIAELNPLLAGFEVDLIGLAREQGVDPRAAASLYSNALQLGLIDGFRGTEVRTTAAGYGLGQTGNRFERRETIDTIDTRMEGDLLRDYKTGFDLYNSDAIFATLHVIDPDLAAKLADPESAYTAVTRDEWNQVRDILGTMNPESTGWKNTTFSWMERGWEGLAGDGTQGNGTIINKGAVRENLRQLSQSWNLGNVSDSELESLVSGFVSESLSKLRSQAPHPLVAVPAGGENEITDTPSEQEYLRQTDRYKDLYGRKSQAESEEEYAYRFTSAAQGFLGDIGSNMGFEHAGMRTGDIQTTLGQAAFSPEAQTSSTFLERMARTAEVVRGMT